jgi:hypothetical protein
MKGKSLLRFATGRSFSSKGEMVEVRIRRLIFSGK